MIRPTSFLGDALLHGAPLARTAVHDLWRAVTFGAGTPRSAVARLLNIHAMECEPLVEFCGRTARLRLALAGRHVPRLITALGRNERVLGWLEEDAGEIHLRDLLSRLVAAGAPLPTELALQVTRSVAGAWLALEALDPEARMGLAPNDILLGWDGEARVLAEPYPGWNEQLRGAAVGLLRGSVEWLAPETLRGLSHSQRSPMFGLGLMLFELLIGRHPLSSSGGPFELLRAIVEDRVPAVASLRGDLPPSVARLVARCTEHDPSGRYPSWAALVSELDEARRNVEPFGARHLAALLADLFPRESAEAGARSAALSRLDVEALRARLPSSDLVPIPISPFPASPGPPPPARPSAALSAAGPEIDLWGRDLRPMLRVGARLLVDLRPVTHAEYARFVISAGHAPPPSWSGRTPPASIEDEPVTWVSLVDAKAYAQWAGKRVPEHDEWEQAFRVLGAARLGLGRVWECTATQFGEAGWAVRGGRWRDLPAEPARPENSSTETAPSPDVGFRCVADD